MSRVYFFGDSLTFGTGCTVDEEYYHKYGGPEEKLWPDIVSEYFKSAKFNKAQPGITTETILDQFYSSYSDIIPGVMKVVLFKGFYDRIDLLSNTGDLRVLHHYGTNRDDSYNDQYFTKEELELISKYGTRFLMDNPSRLRMYEQTFQYISNSLDKMGIEHIIWEPGELDPLYKLNRSNRLSIAYATGGEMMDGHFSYEGHKIFAEWIIEKFNDKYKYKKTKLVL